MSHRADVAPDVGDDTVDEALTDHHLDEVNEMIERARADQRASEAAPDEVRAG